MTGLRLDDFRIPPGLKLRTPLTLLESGEVYKEVLFYLGSLRSLSRYEVELALLEEGVDPHATSV